MRTGKVSKKVGQRGQLILALLQQPSLEKAAASIGISTVTAWRISKTREFKEEYRNARWEAFSQSLARLQQASGAAVSALLKVMIDKTTPAASRVRAADRVLDHASRATALEDIEARISAQVRPQRCSVPPWLLSWAADDLPSGRALFSVAADHRPCTAPSSALRCAPSSPYDR